MHNNLKLTKADKHVSEHLKLFLNQILTHCSFASKAQKTFVALHLVFPMPQNWRFDA